MDEYGARLNATQDEQVKAIISFFRQRVFNGELRFMAGKPKQRDPYPKVARNSSRLLSESVKAYEAGIRELMTLTDAKMKKQKSQIFLGSFDDHTMQLYEELEQLKTQLLDKKKSEEQHHKQESMTQSYSVIEAQKKQHWQESKAMQDICHKIEHVLNKIAERGPKVADLFKGYLSVEQTHQMSHPTHLPDIQRETTKFI